MEYSTEIQDYLKPRKGKIKQGYYIPENKEKYIGDISKIIYRSNWEKNFLHFCDFNESIIRYKSEPFSIKYFNPLDKRTHQYFVDFYIETIDKNGVVSKALIEIKPERHTQKPTLPKVKTAKSMKNFNSAYKMYIMNISKFKAANTFAKINGLDFRVLHMDRGTGKFKEIKWKNRLF